MVHTNLAKDDAHQKVQGGAHHTRPGWCAPAHAQDQAGLFQSYSLVLSTLGSAKMVQRARYPAGESDHIDISMVQIKWKFQEIHVVLRQIYI